MEVRSAFFWAVATAVFWGVAPFVEKLGVTRVEPLLATALRSFTVSLVLLLFLGVTGQFPKLLTVDLRGLGVVAGGALLAGLLGQLTYFLALRRGLPATVVPVVGAYPLVTVLLAALLLGERVTLVKALGALLIVSGVILVKLPA